MVVKSLKSYLYYFS